MNSLDLDVQALRLTYNKLTIRRNAASYVYDVMRGRQAKQIASCFRSLAQKLRKEHIDPKKYLIVLSNYGKFQNDRKLPYPGFLSSDKAIEIYKWVVVKEQKKYYSEKQMMDGLTQGMEINPKEILGAVKESVDQLKKVKAKITPAILYAVRDGLKPWYLALRKDFLNEYFDMLDKDERKQLRVCRLVYKQNGWLKQKAKELV